MDSVDSPEAASESKYSAPRMLSCGDGGVGGNVEIKTV